MNNLTIIRHSGTPVVDSREVAEMVGKQHAHLLRDIANYIEILTQSNFGFSEFFIPSTYQDSTGRTLPCYYLTRKGCDMVANKMTGEKGVLFTAAYVTKFEEMEKALQKPLTQAEMFLQAAQIMAQQERQIHELKEAQTQQSEQLTVLNHRISNLDHINIEGDLQQRLNSMVRKYAHDNGVDYRRAWHEFTQRYNTAYRANLNASKGYYEERHGKQITTPAYLAAVGKLEDAIRVADKMINRAS